MEFLRILNKKKIVAEHPTRQQPKGDSRLEAVRGLSSYSWLIILLGVILIGSLWLFVHYQINDDYDRTIEAASQETMNLSKAFEEHVRRVVSEADKELLNLKAAYEQAVRLGLNFVTVMKDAVKDDPSQNQVAVINEQGNVVSSSIITALGMNFSDREHFQFHRDASNNQLYIAKVILGGRVTAQNTIPLTRRINKPDGSFGGVVYIGLRSEYFLSFYQKIDLGQDGLISLAGRDGFNRARRFGDNFETGHDIRSSQYWKKIQNGRSFSSYLETSIFDGVTRVASYRIMPEYPLIVAVGKSTQVVLAGFEQRKQVYIFWASVVSLFILAFCILLINRHENLREQHEALLAKEEELSEVNRKLIETGVAVQKQKDWLSALVNSMSDEVWFIGTDGEILLANQEACIASIGISIEELASNIEILTPDGSPRPIEEFPGLRALHGECVSNVHRIVRNPANGELRHSEVSACPVKDASANIIGSVVVMRDITERKRLEDEVAKAQEDRYKTCFDNMLDCFAIFIAKRDDTGRIVDLVYQYVNDSASKNNQMTSEEHLGRGLLEIFPGHESTGLFDKYCEVVETGNPLELESLFYDGDATISGAYDIHAIKSDDGIALSWRNITEKKNLEGEIARLDRLNLIGEMAAGIGHEIRNPLTTVRGYLQLFGTREKYADHKEQFETMIDELDRANLIITEFLSLAKDKRVDLKLGNLNGLVTQLYSLMQVEALKIGYSVHLEINGIVDIILDEKEIRQLLLNLVHNAREAIPPGGSINIKTSQVDEYVILSVQDNGHGIPEDMLANLGTPFITTKDNGTGLGLPVCYRIAERHNASIEIATSTNGTTFKVSFPIPTNKCRKRNAAVHQKNLLDEK